MDMRAFRAVRSRLFGKLCAATLSALTLVVWVPSSASAGGPSKSCDAGNYCLSQFAFTSGSTATSMSYGWASSSDQCTVAVAAA